MSAPYPHIRSYRLRPRHRALSPLRAARYERLAAAWTLPADGEELDLHGLFGTADVVLDIGFGGGEGLIELAGARLDEAVIGVEVHTPGVANVLEAVDDNGWKQIRVVEGDVLELLPRVPLQSLTSVRMFFPDPWPKNKQRNRRLARPDVVTQIVNRLRVGGTWHVATDIEEYAQQVIDVAAGDDRLSGGVVPRPSWRPSTRYELRGLAAGRTAVDLIYERLR